MQVPPSARSLELRALAARLAPALSRGGASVAITGSVARGDASSGSDLDLWVLGPASGREHLRVGRVPVTLLRQRPREARRLESLCLYEVDDLVVLADAAGHFRAVQRAHSRQRGRVRRSVLQATWADLAVDLDLARGASPLQRVHLLRQVCFRLAATWLYLATGWRVPKDRALAAHLPVRLRRDYEAVLGLPVTVARARAVAAALDGAVRAARRFLAAEGARLGRRWVAPAAAPRELRARLRAGEASEAVLLARRHLRLEVLPAVLGFLGARDVAVLRGRPGARPVWRALQLAEGPLEGRLRRAPALVAGLVASALERSPRLTSRAPSRARGRRSSP